MLDRRRTERIFLRIPIAVRGVDESDHPFTEDTSTVEINRDGARIGLRNTLRADSELQITNAANNFTALFRANEQCPQSYDGLPEWSVLMTEPESDFWGISFEEKNVEDERRISAMLTCQVCGRQEVVRISQQDYDTLLRKLFLPRLCVNCRIVAKWEVGSPGEGTSGRPRVIQSPPDLAGAALEPASTPDSGASAMTGFAQASPEPAAVSVETAEPAGGAKPGAERRGARRLALKVPIFVKGPTGDSENTETVDLSKTGLSFTTGLNLVLGDLVQIVVGHGVAAAPPTQVARVIWRRPEQQGVRALVGVQFTEAVSSDGDKAST